MNTMKEYRGEKLLTFAESATRIGCTRGSLHKIAKSLGLAKITFPGRTRAHGFLESDIDRLLAGRKEV
jgi:hypothetical protein